MQYLGKLKKFSHIKSLPNPQDGDLAYCEERHEYYSYNAGLGIWKKREVNTKAASEISLYELNKNMYSNQGPITDEEIIKEKINIVKDYYNNTKNKYYMLLCREKSYYTILNHKNTDMDLDFENLGHAVTQLFFEQGWEIYDIYLNENTNAIEIWTRDPNCQEDNVIHCMMLFGYDLGVVTFGG